MNSREINHLCFVKEIDAEVFKQIENNNKKLTERCKCNTCLICCIFKVLKGSEYTIKHGRIITPELKPTWYCSNTVDIDIRTQKLCFIGNATTQMYYYIDKRSIEIKL